MTHLDSVGHLEQRVNQLTPVRNFRQDDVLRKVSYDVQTIARQLPVCQIHEEGHDDVHDLETLDQVVFILFHEAQVPDD